MTNEWWKEWVREGFSFECGSGEDEDSVRDYVEAQDIPAIISEAVRRDREGLIEKIKSFTLSAHAAALEDEILDIISNPKTI